MPEVIINIPDGIKTVKVSFVDEDKDYALKDIKSFCPDCHMQQSYYNLKKVLICTNPVCPSFNKKIKVVE